MPPRYGSLDLGLTLGGLGLCENRELGSSPVRSHRDRVLLDSRSTVFLLSAVAEKILEYEALELRLN